MRGVHEASRNQIMLVCRYMADEARNLKAYAELPEHSELTFLRIAPFPKLKPLVMWGVLMRDGGCSPCE